MACQPCTFITGTHLARFQWPTMTCEQTLPHAPSTTHSPVLSCPVVLVLVLVVFLSLSLSCASVCVCMFVFVCNMDRACACHTPVAYACPTVPSIPCALVPTVDTSAWTPPRLRVEQQQKTKFNNMNRPRPSCYIYLFTPFAHSLISTTQGTSPWMARKWFALWQTSIPS